MDIHDLHLPSKKLSPEGALWKAERNSRLNILITAQNAAAAQDKGAIKDIRHPSVMPDPLKWEPRDKNRWFDENPRLYKPELEAVQEFIIQNRLELAIDTMINWTPFYLFLALVNRHATLVGHPRIPEQDLYDFLHWTSLAPRKQLFEYSSSGAGIVHRIDSGWASASKPRPVPGDPAFTADEIYKAFEERFINIALYMWDGSEDRRRLDRDDQEYDDFPMYDTGRDFAFKCFDEEQRSEDPQKTTIFTRVQFNRFLDYWCMINHLVVKGPPGVLRRIAEG